MNTETKEKPAPINNTELVEEFRQEGGRIVHFRDDGQQRGTTFAYRLKGKRVEIATALTHTVDTFTKKVGTKVAIEHFRAGKTVFLPVRYPENIIHTLRSIVRYS